MAARAGATVKYNGGNTAYADLGISEFMPAARQTPKKAPAPATMDTSTSITAEVVERYLGAVVEIKRYSRLPDGAFEQLLEQWLDDEPIHLTMDARGEPVFERSTRLPIDDELWAALYFVLEAAAYAWAMSIK